MSLICNDQMMKRELIKYLFSVNKTQVQVNFPENISSGFLSFSDYPDSKHGSGPVSRQLRIHPEKGLNVTQEKIISLSLSYKVSDKMISLSLSYRVSE